MMTIEALAMLAMARVWLLAVPFSSVARRLGTPTAALPHDVGIPPLADVAGVTARKVSMIVSLVSRGAPFRAVCLHQAIAARLMLRRRSIPSVLSFGIARSVVEGRPSITAHAWLRAGSIEVTGFDVAAQFVEITRFE